MMDISKLKHNANAVHKSLKKMKDGSVVALGNCEIHIPSRYLEASLASIGNVVEFVSIYAIVVGNNYGVSTTTSMVRSEPSDSRTEVIDDIEYMVFVYEKGDVVFTDSKVVKIDTLVYFIWNEFIDKGKSAWFLTRDIINRLMITAKSHSDATLGANYVIIEMVNSVRMRNDKERTEHIRYTLNAGRKASEIVIGLRNIQLTADSTSAKIGGSYAEIGISSAILNPSDKSEGLETILLS